MTEAAPTATERFTRILLRAVLDYLELWDILAAMRVSRLWREHAVNHPAYYGDLLLFDWGPFQSLDAFLLRLSRSQGRPVSIYVTQTPLRVMQEIGNHLAHITSLSVSISPALSVKSVLEHLCHPAPVLRKLNLRLGEPTESITTPPTLPADLLAHRAPALDNVSFMGFDLSAGIPELFSAVKVLSFYGWMSDASRVFVLPNPFEHCAKLRELHLGNNSTLHPDAYHPRHHMFWKRMTKVSFIGSEIANRWPEFQLPLYDVLRITVSHGTRDSVLALASTLLGPLHVIFAQPSRHTYSDGSPLLFYTAELRSMSRAGGHSRVYTGFLNQSGISVFSMPSLADRIVRLELSLDAWDDFVSMETFGPFNSLDELVLQVQDDSKLDRRTAFPKLSCPKLRRLVLRRADSTATIGIAPLAEFVSAALSTAQLPLMLVVNGIKLSGAWKDFPESFSGSVNLDLGELRPCPSH